MATTAPNIITTTPARHTVNIMSDPPDRVVDMVPDDENGDRGGTTPFSREYLPSASVILTAPAKSGVRLFLEWRNAGGDIVSRDRAYSFAVGEGGESSTLTAYYEFGGDKASDYVVAGGI